MDYYPIYLKLTAKPCVVIGGGNVATRKISTLIDAGASVSVVSLSISSEIAGWIDTGAITSYRQGEYQASDLSGQLLVIAATPSSIVNQQVFDDAEQVGVLANVVDTPELCRFILPSIVDRSPLMIAISSGGAAPVLARMARQKLETLIPFGWSDLARFAGGLRSQVKSRLKSVDERRRFWEYLFESPVANLVMAGRADEAVKSFNTALDAAEEYQNILGGGARLGEVYLVGAGPGDPELLTLKALRLMQQADVVLYDNLVSKDILSLVRRDAERISVAKAKGRHSIAQTEINSEMVRLAGEGKRVCRLKGGDPFIFGRGGEELASLVDAGIPFQVVPGISAANGCAAYAGIPLTHRDFADSVTFVTGHRKNRGYFDLPWKSLSTDRQTLVFYMGLTSAGLIRDKLIGSGMLPSTPVAVVEQGTRIDQRVLVTRLDALPEEIASNAMASPALIIVGGVVTLTESLSWFGTNLITSELAVS